MLMLNETVDFWIVFPSFELIWCFIVHLGLRLVQSAALCCPLATDSSTKPGPDGGGGGAKEEGRSLDVFLGGGGVVRPGKLWGEAMDSLFGPTWIGGAGKPGETSEVT